MAPPGDRRRHHGLVHTGTVASAPLISARGHIGTTRNACPATRIVSEIVRVALQAAICSRRSRCWYVLPRRRHGPCPENSG
jgi:hypothetical protein